MAGQGAVNALKKHFLNDITKGSNWENLNKMSLVGAGLGTIFGISDYNTARDEGKGIGESLMSAAGNFAMGMFLPFKAFLAMEAVSSAPGLAVDAYDWASQRSRQLQKSGRNVPFQNATFLDSQQTYTMRQAGMNIAKQGRYAAQAAMLGNEAQSVSAAYQGRR